MIEISHLVKDFGRVRAVNDLTLTVGRGEFFGFLGPNGAGKTTTIKMMAGLLRPNAGSIRLSGLSLDGDATAARRICAYIPDKPFIYEKLTGREFLRFIGHLWDMDRKEIEKKIEMVKDLFSIGGWIDDLIEGYSHGMKQKTVMAQALLHDPQIIIVDEPMVGLDPRSIRLVGEIFTDLSRKGTTIFMSTHTLTHAEEMCHRIGIINRGVLVAAGSIDELMTVAHTANRELEEIFFTLTEEDGAVR
ncbi:MAG: ABC transporter ATP-binding protein [Deltaproteobacteria bacterium]|nr:ABC transporter ATP-binding protein [Candidatus Zymogenaceae bacterium]